MTPSRSPSVPARVWRIAGKALKRTVRTRLRCPKKLSKTAVLKVVDPDAINIVRDHMAHRCVHCSEKTFQFVERVAADDVFHAVVEAVTHSRLLPVLACKMTGGGMELLAIASAAANLLTMMIHGT
nr:hypothetical protein TetV2_00350 [Oceanusvirus sp.]